MSQTSSQGADSWIATFCSLMGHEYFAEVSEDFIEDDFNLTGLQAQVPMYKEALEMILDVEPSETGSDVTEAEEEEEDDDDDDGVLGDELDEPAQNGARGDATPNRRHGRSASDTSVIESSAELLYGLIHARYITSRPGIQQMMEKYELAHFGYCPRVYCSGTKVLPVGRTDTPGQETVKLFCPSCLDIYTPPNSRFQAVDGAFFGTTFPSLFFMTFPEHNIAPAKRPRTRDNEAVDDGYDSNVGATEPAGAQGAGLNSRSSSLTLPHPPVIPGVNAPAAKDDRTASTSQQQQTLLPPQPAVINGVATQNLAPGLGKDKIYEPKIYGFRVSERAKGGPRLKWLRSKPQDVNELDEARLYHDRYGGNVDGDPDEEAEEEEGDAEDDDEDEDEDEDEEEEEEEEEEAGQGNAEAAGLEDKDGDRIMGSQSQTQSRTNSSSRQKGKGTARSRGGANVSTAA